VSSTLTSLAKLFIMEFKGFTQYKLNADHTVEKLEPDALYYLDDNRVALDELENWKLKKQFPFIEKEKVIISTVFLTFDHSFGMSEEPVLFETMIFGGKHDGYQTRYTTWESAKMSHELIVSAVKRKKDPEKFL